MFQNNVEQGGQVFAGAVLEQRGGALLARAVDDRAVELFVGRAEVQQQFKHFVDHFVQACVRPVYFVDYHDYPVVELQRALEYKPRLRHGPLKSVHEQQHAVDHFQNALHLAAEIGMPRRIDDVDLDGRLYCTDVFFASMVIPRSRSRSLESMTLSATTWLSRKIPLCLSISSTSVVFPWST